MSEISLYFHVPYCRNKCIYCDFYSGGLRIANWKGLTEAFLNEMDSRQKEWEGNKVVSIYLGGGTPSLMPEEMLNHFFYKLRNRLGTDGMDMDCEITIEANPEDINKDTISNWKSNGINRVSVGIQTFNDDLLKSIGRKHTSEQALEALLLLKNNFNNINADLIFGLPNQTLNDVRKDLDKMMMVKPQHISIYSLMYEEGTAMTHLRDVGRIEATDDAEIASMFELIINRLRDEGYGRYEISNYSLPGYESRHNSGYWKGRKYIGLGPSAHSYDGNSIRYANPSDIKGYLKRYSANHNNNDATIISEYNPIIEHLTPTQRVEERIMLGLRLKDGLDLNLYEEEFGQKEGNRIKKASEKSIIEGLIEIDTCNHLKLTDKAILISDRIIVDLLPEEREK